MAHAATNGAGHYHRPPLEPIDRDVARPYIVTPTALGVTTELWHELEEQWGERNRYWYTVRDTNGVWARMTRYKGDAVRRAKLLHDARARVLSEHAVYAVRASQHRGKPLADAFLDWLGVCCGTWAAHRAAVDARIPSPPPPSHDVFRLVKTALSQKPEPDLTAVELAVVTRCFFFAALAMEALARKIEWTPTSLANAPLVVQAVRVTEKRTGRAISLEEVRTVHSDEAKRVKSSDDAKPNLNADIEVELRPLLAYEPYMPLSHRWLPDEEVKRLEKLHEYLPVHVKVIIPDGALDSASPLAQHLKTGWTTTTDVNLLRLLFRYGGLPSDNRIPLWVDALCIDQNRDEHKSAQVGFMGKLYACGTSLIVSERFASQPPAPEYMKRTWTHQERLGSVLPWYLTVTPDLDHEDWKEAPFKLFNAVMPPNYRGEYPQVGQTMYAPTRDAMQSPMMDAVERLGFWSSATRVLKPRPLIAEPRISKACELGVLLLVHEFGRADALEFFRGMARMRTYGAALSKDKLFGVFGVTSAVLGAQKRGRPIVLNYDNPTAALKELIGFHEAPSIAFLRGDGDPLCSDGSLLEADEQDPSPFEDYDKVVARRKATRAEALERGRQRDDVWHRVSVVIINTSYHDNKDIKYACRSWLDMKTGNVGVHFHRIHKLGVKDADIRVPPHRCQAPTMPLLTTVLRGSEMHEMMNGWPVDHIIDMINQLPNMPDLPHGGAVALRVFSDIIAPEVELRQSEFEERARARLAGTAAEDAPKCHGSCWRPHEPSRLPTWPWAPYTSVRGAHMLICDRATAFAVLAVLGEEGRRGRGWVWVGVGCVGCVGGG